MTEKIIQQNILTRLKSSYINYSMSVIVSRALPDVRDGLKPVHRRVLFAMEKLGCTNTAKYKKSARVVGDVIGKYHPHGDTAAYDTLVRMAQPFSLNAVVIDGQGNFGSIDGDSCAAMRYTECRMSKIGDGCFDDINKDTVDFEDNYDGTEKMPSVLPVRFPQLLVNGSQGIAVGMAANIPSHNPIEALDCVSYLLNCELNNETANLEQLMSIMPGPDMPTGGIVHGLEDMRDVWMHGRGSFRVMSKWHQEVTDSGKEQIVVTEIPYAIKKSALVEKLIELTTKDKQTKFIKVEGVDEVRDESDQDGIRICIDVNREHEPQLVFNELAKHSSLDVSKPYNMVVIKNGAPKLIGILEALEDFIEFRKEVVIRRTQYLLNGAEKQLDDIEGLVKMVDGDLIDKVVEIIRAENTPLEAKVAICKFLDIKEHQAQVILDLRLHKLVNTERDVLIKTVNALREDIAYYKTVLANPDVVIKIILDETSEEREKFEKFYQPQDRVAKKRIFAERRSECHIPRINITLADMVKKEESAILFTANGQLRRVPLSDLNSQNPRTQGRREMNLRDGDVIKTTMNCHSHDQVMFVTEQGRVYTIYAYEISGCMRGKHVNNVVRLQKGDSVICFKKVDLTETDDKYITMFTKHGRVKVTKLSEYASSTRPSGKIGIKLVDDDQVVNFEVTNGTEKMYMVSSGNRIAISSMGLIRSQGRNSRGVTGIRLDDGNHVVSAGVGFDSALVAAVTKNGKIKISELGHYRETGRGAKGSKVLTLDEKNDALFAAMLVDSEQDILTITKQGLVNRISLDKFRTLGKYAKGSTLITLQDNDTLTSVMAVMKTVEPSEEASLVADYSVVGEDI